jgi:hypothetical protein
VTTRRIGPLAVAVAAVVLPVSPAHASGLPPVTQPDAVTVTIDGREAHLDLGANDVDPEGEPVQFGGTDRHIPGVGIIDNTKTGGPQDVVVFASTFPRPGDTSPVMPGVYQVTTFMNDGTSTSASTLTITVLPSPGDAVELTKKRHRGQVVVHNDNAAAVRFYWGAEGRRRADGIVDIPAHGSRRIEVLRKSLVILVVAGSDFAIDVRRHFKVPHDGTALPPGVEPGHGLFEVRRTRWVRRATGT